MNPDARLVHVRLPDPYGRLTVLERLDFTTGHTRFDMHATRATGTLLFIPHTDLDHALPVGLYIQYGDGERWSSQGRYHCPQFNGVRLDGGTLLRPESQHLKGLQYRLNLNRPNTTWYRDTRYPDKASEHATAVIGALLTHWLALPQRDQLIRAAARFDAGERIRQITRDTIDPGWAQIAETSAAIDRAYALVEQLRDLTGPDP